MAVDKERRNERARELGYSSYYAYHKSGQSSKDEKYFQAWRNSNMGQHAEQIARNKAREEGRKYTPADFKTELIKARNDRPHGRTGYAGGAVFWDFTDQYELMDYEDWYDY